MVATLLGVLALAVQGLVVQTHIEGLAGFGSRAAAQHAAADTSGYVGATADAANKPAQGAPCIICQEIARAGAGILAPAPEFGFVESYSIAANAVRLAAPPCIVAAHSWQSRAPPQLS